MTSPYSIETQIKIILVCYILLDEKRVRLAFQCMVKEKEI